jgi:hypothetical protein
MQVIGDSEAPVIKKHISLPVPVKATKPSVIPYYQKKYKKGDKDIKTVLFQKHFQNIKDKPKKAFTQGTAIPGNFDGSFAITHNQHSSNLFYYFIIFFLLGLFAYLTYLRRIFNKYFLQISGAVVNIQLSNRLFRDRSALFEKVEFQLNLFFIIIGGLFIFYCLKINNIIPGNLNEITILLLSISALAAYLIYRYISIKITGFFMMRSNEFDEYLHNAFIYYKVLGIILLPTTIFMIFLPGPMKEYPMYFGLAFFGIMFILRILRCFLLIVDKGILLLYAILYLCTIEILPLLLLGKYALSFTK